MEVTLDGPDGIRAPPQVASAAAPSGVRASLVSDARTVTVRCSADGGKEVVRTWPAGADCEIGHASMVWPAASARIAMVSVGIDCGGEGPLDYTRTLVEVCSLKGLVEVDEFVIGPADVWAHSANVADGRNWSIRRGFAGIGSVRGEPAPIFRP